MSVCGIKLMNIAYNETYSDVICVWDVILVDSACNDACSDVSNMCRRR